MRKDAASLMAMGALLVTAGCGGGGSSARPVLPATSQQQQGSARMTHVAVVALPGSMGACAIPAFGYGLITTSKSADLKLGRGDAADQTSSIAGGVAITGSKSKLEVTDGASITGNSVVLSDTKIKVDKSGSMDPATVDDGLAADAANQARNESASLAALPTGGTDWTSNSIVRAGGKGGAKNSDPYHQSDPIVINGGAGQNVLNLTDFDVTGTTVTLNAPTGGTFVINVRGKLNLQNASLLVGGDLHASDVIVNVVGTAKGGDRIELKSEDDKLGDPLETFDASLLAPDQSKAKFETVEIFGGVVVGDADLHEQVIIHGCGCF